MKKKIMALLLAFALVAGVVVSPVGMETVKAETVFASVIYGIVGIYGDDAEVVIPEGTTALGYNGSGGITYTQNLYGCQGITKLIIPASLSYIGDTHSGSSRVFAWCDSLTDFVVAGENKYFASEGGVLYNKDKTEIICCPQGKTELAIPASVTTYAYDAFYRCNRLEKITVAQGNSVFEVKNGVLYAKNKNGEGRTLLCCLAGTTQLEIPADVTDVNASALASCSKLTAITVAQGNTTYTSVDGVLLYNNRKSLRCCPGGKTKVVIPATVSGIDRDAFSELSILAEITVEAGNTEFTSVDGALYAKHNDGELALITICPPRKTTLKIPANVTRIKDGMLDSSNLMEITVAEGNPQYTSLDGVLYSKNGENLYLMRCPRGKTSVSIPANTTGGDDLGNFRRCTNLTDVYFGGSEEQWKNVNGNPKSYGWYDLWNVKVHFNCTGPQNPEQPQKTNQTITAKNITKTYGAKPFSLGAKSNAGTKLTYSVSDKKVATVDKNGKVTIKNCGITNITITAKATDKYNQAKKTIKLTVKPRKMTVSSVKSTKKKTATVQWKKDNKASGYIVQCATDSKFKKNKVQTTINKNKTVSATVKKLKAGKKYYVRVCAYTKSGKTKVQGDWSKVKTVKVKK